MEFILLFEKKNRKESICQDTWPLGHLNESHHIKIIKKSWLCVIIIKTQLISSTVGTIVTESSSITLEFENRDLQIWEHKHAYYFLFQQVLSQHLALAKKCRQHCQRSLYRLF